jgi:hypothetical protein
VEIDRALPGERMATREREQQSILEQRLEGAVRVLQRLVWKGRDDGKLDGPGADSSQLGRRHPLTQRDLDSGVSRVKDGQGPRNERGERHGKGSQLEQACTGCRLESRDLPGYR